MKPKAGVHLTKKLIESFPYTGRITTTEGGRRIEPRCVLWAAEPRGLGLRVYPSGRKAWVLAYEVEGRKRLMQLGGYPPLTLEKAKRAAEAHVGKIAAAEAVGAPAVDPLSEREENRRGRTVADLVDAFLSQHADAKRKPRTAAEYRRQLETHIKPRWGARLAKSIKRSDVAAFHAELGARAAIQANRTLSALSKMFNFGRIKGFLPDDAPNPCQGIERFSEHKRDRWVREGELPRIVEAVNAEPNPYARAAVWLFLLTGARRTELLKAKWEHVDEERGELRLPEENTKAGRAHYIPLSAPALAVLGAIPRQKGNPYILCGAKEGAHLVNIDRPWRRTREAATLARWSLDPRVAAVVDRLNEENERRPKRQRRHGPPTCAQVRAAIDFELPTDVLDIRIHDLRRTVGSWLATAGESLPLIGKVLNHADVKTTAIYARLAEDPVRRALEEHGRRILEAAEEVRRVVR